jgi:hypothetical protein
VRADCSHCRRIGAGSTSSGQASASRAPST